MLKLIMSERLIKLSTLKTCQLLDGTRRDLQRGLCRLTVRLSEFSLDPENMLIERLVVSTCSVIQAIMLTRAKVLKAFFTQFPNLNLEEAGIDFDPNLQDSIAGRNI